LRAHLQARAYFGGAPLPEPFASLKKKSSGFFIQSIFWDTPQSTWFVHGLRRWNELNFTNGLPVHEIGITLATLTPDFQKQLLEGKLTESLGEFRLSIHGDAPSINRFLSHLAKASLPGLRGINFFVHEPVEKGLREFLQSPNFHMLRSLGLHGRGIRDTDLAHLAQSPWLSHLRFLSLSNSEATDVGIEALSKSPDLSSLEVLELDSTNVRFRGVAALARAPSLRLRSLHLGITRVPDRAIATLARARNMERLKDLELNANRISDRSLQSLANSRIVRLENLSVNSEGVSDIGFVSLVQSPSSASLRGIWMPLSRYIGPMSLRAAMTSPFTQDLVALALEDALTEETAEWVIRHPSLAYFLDSNHSRQPRAMPRHLEQNRKDLLVTTH
jgi:hypothetical protein